MKNTVVLSGRIKNIVERPLGPDADEYHPLEPDLAVFDLGDVLELSGQPGDTPERRTLLELEFAGGRVVENWRVRERLGVVRAGS
mgnify:CR=1 FL=1